MRRKVDLTGQRFGRLTVIAEDPKRGSNHRVKRICRCDCGNTVSVLGQNLKGGITRSCGCLHDEKAKEIGEISKIDLTGQQFGRLTVIKEDPTRDKKGNVKWICKCDCGNIVSVRGDKLRNGHTRSCGCLYDEKIRKIDRKGVKIC